MSFSHQDRSALLRAQRRGRTNEDTRTQEGRPASIKLTLVNAIIMAASGLFLVSLGYIGNDLKKSYLDLGQVKADISSVNTSVSKLEDKVDLKFEEVNKKLDLLVTVHTKN